MTEKEVEIMVVKELPLNPSRLATLEDGRKVEFMTTEEALTKIINGVN